MVIKNIALIGMGAIGSVYGKFLYDKYDNNFVVVAGGQRAQKLESGGVSVNGQVFFPKVVVPEEKRWKADLLLVCVKNEQLDEALNDVKNVVGTNTIILSLLSGVSAVSKIESVFPDNITLSGMAIGLDVAREDTTIVSNALGKMDISGSNGKFVEEQVAAVKACLGDAGIDSEVLNDANSQMWKRWLFNIGVNQVASVLGLKYGQIEKVPMAVGLMRLVMQEAIGVTNEINKMGILKVSLSAEDIEEAIVTATLYPTFSKPSMLQDFEAKRKTEVESFSGMLLNLSKKLELATPINRTLYMMIKGQEQMYVLDKIV
ncbi:MAG: 2-dehydropantoate 2-reductase [Clostridia bacterium]|nr:2-dehydropantoate 2-reductase [Clostridia bacterium]